jgi:molecular chaperone DnaK (HSP70)
MILKAQTEMKNKLEALIYQIRNSLTDTEIDANISSDEKNKLVTTTNCLRKWIEDNPNAPIESYEHNKTQLEQLRNVIFTRIYLEIPDV